MSAIFISEFSSLNFRKDWKLSFQQNVDYIPKFLPTDNIQVQYVVKDFTLTPYLKNICTGEVQQLSPVLLLETESEKCYQLTINNSSISSDTEFNLYFASDQDGEKIKDANFCVCTELPDTILLEYTNRKNVYETIFDGIDRFLFRVEGAFLPQEISFENNTEEFRDQRYVSKILSSTAFEKKTLTLGGGMGVPNWVARKINLIFSLSSVHVEGNPMVRSDGGAVELTEIGKYYPLYIYKIVLEDGEDNEDTGDGIIEYLRAVDEKKKIIRKSSENDLRVYLEGTGIDTAKMIRELELIGELSMNYTIEIDDNLSGSTNKTTLQSLIQFISKDFVTNNKFDEYIDQPVKTTDDVKFNSVEAKESVSTEKVTTEEVVSKDFKSGLLGVGHRLWDGVLEVSELIVRKTMHVFEIIVQKITSVNGSMLTTPGGGIRISEVEELEDGYKCFFNNDDGTIPNPFVVGDQALHQVFTGKNISRYWRLVTEVGDNYFVLSKTDCEAGSGIPQVEDEIIQFGNRTDKNRQNAVLTTSYGSDAPYTAYYSNVNSYSLEGKEDVREGNLRGINDPDFGQLQGSGFYGKHVYLKGIFRLLSGKTVEESIGDVQSNLDNLQVGETNLLDNSNKGWKNTGYPIATIYLGDYKPKQGEECTIVIKGKLGANKTSWGVYNSGGNVVLASFYPGGPDTDYIALKTFKWTLGTPAVDNTFIRIYPMPNSVSVESEIEWVKLVLGNKTSLLWTPSINDQRQIAIDEAGKAVDGIQVGGVNILKGSTTGILWDFSTHNGTEFSRTGTSTAENSYIYSDYIILKGDTEIVLSFYAKHVGVLNGFDLYILPDDFNTYGFIVKGYQAGEDWVYNVLKLKTPSKWGDGKRVRLRIDHNGSPDGSSATIYVKDVQIEYGNKATTYSVPESDREVIAKQHATDIVSERVEEAKQEAIDEAKEYTTIQTYRETDIDLRAEKWDQDTYYPVTIKLSNSETRIEVVSPLAPNFGIPKWSTHVSGFSMNCVWRSNGSLWGANVVKRTIEVFEYKFTKEIPDTTPVQYILPAGSIGQLTSSSEELIYLRGGGRYLFKIGNNCVAVVHDSRYTAPDGSSVAPAASVIRPVLTNATKEELNTEINITKGLIENKVSLDVYNENDQLIKSDISNLQVSYNQISSTVSKIINGTQEISGVVTQSNFVTIFSSNKNALGQEVIESINVGGGGVTIDASRINLNGAISANGNVQITTDGKLIAVNGQFTGKITATEGEIAGLKLSNNGLRSSDFNASSKIGSCYAKNGFSVYASGAGVLTPSIGGMQAGIITAVGDFISHITGLEIIAKETSYNYGSSSKVTALRIQAENRYYGTPFDPPLAIEVVSGDVLFGGKMTVNNTSIFRGQIYLNLNNIPNISGASNYYLCINRSTGQLSYR